MTDKNLVDNNYLKEVRSPLIREILSNIRSKETGPIEFRKGLTALGRYMGYEITKSMEYEDEAIETPLDWAKGTKIIDKDKIVLISVLRASIPYVEGFMEVFPEARMGIISAERGPSPEFDVSIEYVKLPKINSENIVIIADPMLATGSTLLKVLDKLKDYETPERKIISCINSADKGFKKLRNKDPELEVFTAGHDGELNEEGYIVPGLGDAGDRAFGT